MSSRSRLVALATAASLFGAAASARAVPPAGTGVQTDTVGMTLVTRDFDDKKTTTVADKAVASELVGAHYFFADGWRVGMSLEFAELVSKAQPGENRFVTFGFLPQIGWHFYGPFFTALLFGVFPRTSSGSHFDMSVQGLFGVSLPIADRVYFTASLEVPFRFYIHRTLGFIPLIGLAFDL